MKSPMDRRQFLKMMGLLPLLSLPGTRSHSQQNSDRPNVLVIVFDAMSARHLSLYGYARETSPNFANFAKSANVYQNNYAGGSFTSPGTASILTGLFPSSHRAFQAYSTVDPAIRDNNIFSLFQKAGYHTLSFSQNLLVNILLHDFISSTDEWLPANLAALASKEISDDIFAEDYGVAVQAERTALSPVGQLPNSIFLSLISEYVGRRNVASLPRALREEFPRGFPQNHDMYYLLEHVLDWLIDYLPQMPQPYLSYLHFMPPHDPYHPRRDFIGRFATVEPDIPNKSVHFFSEGRDDDFLSSKRDQYDEYIAYVDAEFGRMMSALEAQGALENTIVVLTSDHGELFERGIYRHITPVLYEGITKVPLLIRFPDQKEAIQSEKLTSNVDIFPTLAAAAGLNPPINLDGQDIRFPEEIDEQRIILSMDAKSNPKFGPINLGTMAAIQAKVKLIKYFGYDGYSDKSELYDLDRDPEEQNDLFPSLSTVSNPLIDFIASKRKWPQDR